MDAIRIGETTYPNRKQ